MKMRAKLALGLAAGALVIGSASPAAARDYDGPWHRRHTDGPSAGAVFGVLLGVGLIAAIASASSAKARDEQRGYDPRYRDRDHDPRYDDRREADRDYDSGRTSAASEDQAVDACAVAARDRASQDGGFAEVRDITGVQPYGGGYDVTGTISQRSGYRAGDGRTRSFRCTFDNGRVAGVTFSTAA